MSVIALCSAKGSPGVTTAAFALASTDAFRERSLLVEADPAGGDLASRLGIPAEPGLASLAAAGRRELSAGLVETNCQSVAGIDLVVAPAGAASARAALNVLDGAFVQALKELNDRALFCDLGRLGAADASLELAKAADVVLVVVRPVLADLAHVAEGLSWWTGLGPPVVLVLSGEHGATRRERYPAGEVSAALGLEVIGTLAWDPKGVAALAGQRLEARRSALVQSARSLSDALVQQLPERVIEMTDATEARIIGPATAGAEL